MTNEHWEVLEGGQGPTPEAVLGGDPHGAAGPAGRLDGAARPRTPAQLRRDAARDEARRMRAAGQTCEVIAAALGVSRSTVHNWTRSVVQRPDTPRRRERAERVQQARALRAVGRPHAEIARQLGVSVATVHGWTFDVPVPGGGVRGGRGLTLEERRETARRAWEPRLRAAEARRQQVKLEAANSVRPTSRRDLFVAGLVAYWAEGTKDKKYRRQERVVFVNSDPLMISLFEDWLDLLGVDRSRRRYRVSIHETADLQRAEAFWRELLGLPEGGLGRATIKRHNPRTNRLRTGADYNGCLVIGVTGSANLYRQIEGWWFGLAGRGRNRPGPPTPAPGGSIAV